MMGNNNNPCGRFAEVGRWITGGGSVLVPMLEASHNIHFGTRQGTGTDVLVRESGLLGRVVHIGPDITFQQVVQPAPGREHPLDANVDRAPLALEVLRLPVVHRLRAIQRATVSEVKPCPAHASMIGELCK